MRARSYILVSKWMILITNVHVLLINREVRNHDNAKKEWTDDELKKLYETHERLLDLVSLFCYVPRAKYLPQGPIRYQFIEVHSVYELILHISYVSKETCRLFCLQGSASEG